MTTSNLTQVTNIVDSIREEKQTMFATYPSIGELIEAQGIKGNMVVVVMMAVNTTLELTAKKIEEEHTKKKATTTAEFNAL